MSISFAVDLPRIQRVSFTEQRPPWNRWRELDPAWSPDGRHVLFRAAQKGDVDVHLVEVA